jgi:hypothetical protein
MVDDRGRSCGICGEAIEEGEQFIVLTVPKHKAGPYLALAYSEPDLASRISEDAHGNLRMEVCLACHLHMALQGVEPIQ